MVGRGINPYSHLWTLDQPEAFNGQRLRQSDERLENQQPGGSELLSHIFER
jgi:hypothetical protein